MMIRPVMTLGFSYNILKSLATVCTHFVIFCLFILVAWGIYKKFEKEADVGVPFFLTVMAGLIMTLVDAMTLFTIKGMLLALILLYASMSDIKTRKVSDCISIMISILSLVGCNTADLPSMLMGAAVVFIPQFALAVINPQRSCGGADMKISTALAFLLGAEKGIFALIVGLLLSVITVSIYNKANNRDNKESFALVPFLSVGAMLAYII